MSVVIKIGTPLSAQGGWWPWGDTQLASMYGTQAAWMGGEPVAAAWRALFASPEPFPTDIALAAAGAQSPQTASACPDFCRRMPRLFRYAFAPCVGCEIGERVAPGIAGAIDWKTAALYAAGVGLLLIGALELIK